MDDLPLRSESADLSAAFGSLTLDPGTTRNILGLFQDTFNEIFGSDRSLLMLTFGDHSSSG